METKNWIRTYVIQILPALAFFVYIIGFAYYIVYYYQFGINIISYITLNEVLVSTLVPFLFISTYSAVSFILYFIFRSVIKRYIYISKRIILFPLKCMLNINRVNLLYSKIKRINRHFKEKERMESNYKSVLSVTISSIIFCIVIPLCIYMDKIVVEHKYFIIITLFSISFPAANRYMRECGKIRFEIVKSYHNIVSIIMLYLSILVCSIILGVYNARNDKLVSQKQFCILTINNSTYTNEKYRYVGECGNALFLYSIEDNRTIVLNRPNIVSIVYSTKSFDLYNNVIEDLNTLREQTSK